MVFDYWINVWKVSKSEAYIRLDLNIMAGKEQLLCVIDHIVLLINITHCRDVNKQMASIDQKRFQHITLIHMGFYFAMYNGEGFPWVATGFQRPEDLHLINFASSSEVKWDHVKHIPIVLEATWSI